jgi:hypothetical protein
LTENEILDDSDFETIYSEGVTKSEKGDFNKAVRSKTIGIKEDSIHKISNTALTSTA